MLVIKAPRWFPIESLSSKESLGEYGSGWEWDNDYVETMHVFDQETIIIDSEDSRITHVSPIRYIENGTKQSTCQEDIV